MTTYPRTEAWASAVIRSRFSARPITSLEWACDRWAETDSARTFQTTPMKASWNSSGTATRISPFLKMERLSPMKKAVTQDADGGKGGADRPGRFRRR